jgi:hypothetical protein
MSISKQFKILSIKAEPQLHEKENVVIFVRWAVHFEIDEYSNEAVIETRLDFDPNSTFVPAQDLTKEQILSWVIAKVGGDPFLARLEENHVSHLQIERAQKDLVDLPLSFVENVPQPNDQDEANNTAAAKLASDREYIRGLVSAAKLASDREYIRGLVLEALAEQNVVKTDVS